MIKKYNLAEFYAICYNTKFIDFPPQGAILQRSTVLSYFEVLQRKCIFLQYLLTKSLPVREIFT